MTNANTDVIGEERLSSTLAILRRLINSKSSVVEVGANDASFRALFECESWITLDKYGAPDVKTDINGPEVSLPFESGSVDLLICTEVLEHLTMGTPLVREIARILSENGTAVISVPNIASLKSRAKLAMGKIPHMAASGDCGHPLGGTGVFIDGQWVAGHVVDFNHERLAGYLRRAGLRITKYHKVPIWFSLRRFAIPASVVLPAWLVPKTFCDFILVECGPCKR
jgi:hypothetical protein